MGNDGWFYLTFNCRNEKKEYEKVFGVGLARARKITGPYEILTVEKSLMDDKQSIDGTIFRDDDGTFYLGCNGGVKADALFLHRLDVEQGTLSDRQVVCEKGTEGQWDSVGIEGQCIVKRNGIYFQWYSSWTNGYAAGILTSDSIKGPWKKWEGNPVLSEGKTWYRAGHNHSFRGLDGKDYIVFHANLRESDGADLDACLFGRWNINRMEPWK